MVETAAGVLVASVVVGLFLAGRSLAMSHKHNRVVGMALMFIAIAAGGAIIGAGIMEYQGTYP